ncbi:MAG: GNAT family N-acetyltransferase [Desulfobacterales bacterium]|jgi:mycothiol synthase
MASGSLKFRNYSSDDFDRYLQLHVEAEQLDPSGGLISAQALSDHLGRPNFTPQKDLFVTEFNEKLVGCLSVTLEPGIQRALLDCLVHPLHRRKGVASKLFSSSRQRIRTAGIKTAQISVSETNSAAKSLLMKLEFQFIRHFFEMKLDFNNIQLPAAGHGPTTSHRLKSGEENLLTEIQNRSFADTWGFTPNTEEEIAYRLNMHGRSPDDVILTYLGDHPVGYYWIIINAEENAKRKKNKGLIHMLGVDPDYRQQEIGKAILLNGLEDLKNKGVDIVELTVDSENPAACSLYESVGFEVYAKTEWYEKTVP